MGKYKEPLSKLKAKANILKSLNREPMKYMGTSIKFSKF